MGLISPEQVVRYFLEQGLWREQMTSRLAVVVWLMLVAAAGTWIFLGRTRAGYKVTSVYWLVCALGIWLCMYLPVGWVIPAAVFMIALLSFVFAYVPIGVHKWRWFHAWPDRLELLTERYQPPSGLVTSMTGLSLVVFFLCLCSLCSWGSAVSSFLLGVSLLVLVGYEYRPEAGLAGLVLLSLSFVSGFLALTGASGATPPTVVNLVLIPLAVMAFFWIWLGVVWEQQILEGRPLTTSARLVPLTRHVGMMLLGFSALLGVKLALWPIMPAVSGYDNESGRFVLMGLAFPILLACNFGIAKRMRLSSLGVLAAMNVFAMFMAYVTRFPGFFKRVFVPNWQILVVGYLVMAIVVGFAIQQWNGRRQPERK
jgi:hypothetical protein